MIYLEARGARTARHCLDQTSGNVLSPDRSGLLEKKGVFFTMFRNSFNSVDLDEVSSVPVIHPDQLGGGRHHHLLLLLHHPGVGAAPRDAPLVQSTLQKNILYKMFGNRNE